MIDTENPILDDSAEQEIENETTQNEVDEAETDTLTSDSAESECAEDAPVADEVQSEEPAGEEPEADEVPAEDLATDDLEPTDEACEEGADGKKKKPKKPLPPGLQKIADYLNAHENIRQPLIFFLLSFICGASQIVSQFALKFIVLAITKDPFPKWFIFDSYNVSGGLADFVGFLTGAVVGQAMTFLLNRKTTFKSSNNIVISGIIYAVMAVLIIIVQTYLGGVVTKACLDGAAKNGTHISTFINLLITLTGLLAGGMTALVLSFFGNKLLAIKWPSKKNAATDETPAGDAPETQAAEEGPASEEVPEAVEEDTAADEVPANDEPSAEESTSEVSTADEVPAEDQSEE